jgi:UDP-glucuronate 4-epimerase
MQPGDVYQTNADTTALERDMNYKPSKNLFEGIKETVEWFKDYYKL